ncbi:hypothetical protein SLS55_004414 [Diplodia seriata]|uniref:Nacht domain protein n=1 Tax=Diplodia seriata TaxID=420778 RepID=A0ABR3CML1_9PEZI
MELRIKEFREHANSAEWEEIERSRTEMQLLLEKARTEQEKRHPNRITDGGAQASIRANIKKGLDNAAQVTYHYVKMLDVMVSQAPELVAVAYGAVKIILAVQVNHQEVREKVPAFMKQASTEFEALDHLTAYRPSKNLVSAVAQAYNLYIKFLAKAVKLYTECLPSKALFAYVISERLWKATIHPWKNRFQDIVSNIEETFRLIHKVAQLHGLVDSHLSLQLNRQALEMLKNQQSQSDRMLALLEKISQTVSISFNKAEDVRETATAVRKRVNEVIDQPQVDRSHAERSSQDAPQFEDGSTNSSQSVNQILDVLFPEMVQEESSNESNRRTRAIMEFPSMHRYKAKQKMSLRSEQLITWLKSPTSQLLWLDGSNLLTQSDCNMMFTNPLILAAEGSFDSTIVLRYRHRGTTSVAAYTTLVQSLVSQSLKQNPEIFHQISPRMTKERVKDLDSLWDLLDACLQLINASCVYMIIDGVDELGGEHPQQEEFVNHMNRILNTPGMLVKVLLTATLQRNERLDTVISASILHSQIIRRSPVRTLSIDGMETGFPLLSHELVRLQERKCGSIAFNRLPYLYSPGSTIFEW